MTTAILSSKGQLTLPKSVRLSLGLRQGDCVEFMRDVQGNWELRPRRSIAPKLRGALADFAKTPPTTEQWKQIVRKRHKQKTSS